MSAELRLYINHSMVQALSNDFQDGPDTTENYDPSQAFLITLYEIGKDDSMVYVDSMEISREHQGWIAFNVTLVLSHWLINPEENYGLQLVCRSASSGMFNYRSNLVPFFY